MVAVKKAGSQNVTGMIDELEGVYEFRDEPAVRAFLAANADLLPLLDEIPVRVASYLPTDARLVLEVVEDPGDDDGQPELFAFVPTRLASLEARRRLNAFSRDWWLDAYRHTGSRLNIDVEYR